MAKLAIAALKYTFGNEWQNHELVQGFFDTNKAYKTPLGIRTWAATMDRGERREVVRKTLRGGARTWERQSQNISRAKSTK
jgi:hypothetical protein